MSLKTSVRVSRGEIAPSDHRSGDWLFGSRVGAHVQGRTSPAVLNGNLSCPPAGLHIRSEDGVGGGNEHRPPLGPEASKVGTRNSPGRPRQERGGGSKRQR